MILFLGIAFTGIGLISAHTLDQYAGIGQVGIHGVKDSRSIHIPGDIYFNSQNGIFDRYLILEHDISSRRLMSFPDTNGTIAVFSNESVQPTCTSENQGIMWYNSGNNNAYICLELEWWILHTIHAP